jgi:ribosomal protein S18 acetylase RimI-like enzyme
LLKDKVVNWCVRWPNRKEKSKRSGDFVKNEVVYVEVSDQEFWQEVGPHFEKTYSNRTHHDPSGFFSEEEKENLKRLSTRTDNLFKLRILVKLGDKLVGWHLGQQNDNETYYMWNSAILAEYRGLGYYEKLLKFLVTRLQGEGFQILSSLHHPNNPAILIPKLRMGFIITSTEINDRFGFLVGMKYYVNSRRREQLCETVGLRS